MKKIKLDLKKVFILLSCFLTAILVFINCRANDYYLYQINDGNISLNNEGYLLNNGEMYSGNYYVEIEYESDNDNAIQLLDENNNTILLENISSSNNVLSKEISLENSVRHIKTEKINKDNDVKINSFYCKSVRPCYTDRYWVVAYTIIFVIVAYYIYTRNEDNKFILILLSISIVVSLPLYSDFLQYGHDIAFHLERIDGIAKGLASVDFPVRINRIFGNGSNSISSMMYPELLLYLPGFMVYTRSSTMFAFKSLILIINILTGIICYCSSKTIVSKRTALIFSILYLCNPYRLNNFYSRAAIGEFIAMAFLPLAFAGLYNLIQGDKKKGLYQSIIGISLIFQSHMISTFLFIFFGCVYSIVYIILNSKKFISEKRVSTIICAAIFVLGLNAWFIIPFLKYYGSDFVIFRGKRLLSNTNVTINEMFMDVYNPGMNSITSTNRMPVSIGTISLIGMVLSLIYIVNNKENCAKKEICKYSLILGLFACFLASNFFPWNTLQFGLPIINTIFSNIQFAYRFLSFATLFITFSSSISIDNLFERKNNTLIYSLCLICLYGVCTVLNGYTNLNKTFLTDKSQGYNSNNLDYFIDDNYSYEKALEFINNKEIEKIGTIDILDANNGFDVINFENA